MDEFVKAVMSRWPKAVLQFEDFSLEHAYPLLERYRHHHLIFNDDIQACDTAHHAARCHLEHLTVLVSIQYDILCTCAARCTDRSTGSLHAVFVTLL